jgi:ribosomal protein S25
MSTKDIAVDVSLERKRELWGSVLVNYNDILYKDTKEEDELTIIEFADVFGVSVNHARRIVKTLLSEGKITKRYVVLDKHRRLLVYKPSIA